MVSRSAGIGGGGGGGGRSIGEPGAFTIGGGGGATFGNTGGGGPFGTFGISGGGGGALGGGWFLARTLRVPVVTAFGAVGGGGLGVVDETDDPRLLRTEAVRFDSGGAVDLEP